MIKRDFEEFLFEQRAQSIRGHKNVNLLSEVGVTFSTVIVLWSLFNHVHLLLWALFSVLISALSWLSRSSFQPESSTGDQKRWLLRAATMSFFVAFAWGLVPILFFTTESTNYLIFIVCVYAGYVAGALSVNFSYLPCFLAFCLGISLPFGARMFYQSEAQYTVIGLQVVFFVLMLTYVCANIQKLFVRSARSNYEIEMLNQQLAAEKEAVEQAVAAKDRFLAAASHDLRQPLNAISLFVDALRPLQSGSAGREIVDKIRLSLKGLNGMLHSLLDISRLDASEVEFAPRHICLNSLIEQLVEEYQPKTQVTIQNQLSQDLVVFNDPTLLYRVIRNVLDNAVKYTPSGLITLTADQTDQITRLSVKDTGSGIPQHSLKKVFDEFEQLQNPNRNREKGLGLGLAIVKRLCRIGEIDLELQSVAGEGTEVIFRIASGVRDEVTSIPAESSWKLAGQLLVVIDDERDILEAMQRIIANWGCNCVAADSLEEAMAKLAEQSQVPDIIISDLRLKDGKEGTDAIETLREEYNREIPALLITGDTAPDRISKVRASGLSVMYKPVDSTELRQKVEAELSQAAEQSSGN